MIDIMPANPQLIGYMRQMESKGYPDPQIRNILLQQGWDAISVDDSLSALKGEVQAVQPQIAKKKLCKEALVGFIMVLLFFLPIVPLIGWIMCLHSIFKIKNDPALSGMGFAIAGVVFGVLGLLLVLLLYSVILGVITAFLQANNVPVDTLFNAIL